MPKKPGFVPASTPGATAAGKPARASESAAGTAYVPQVGAVTRGEPATRVAACPAFLVKAHPERWTVAGGAVVPQFGRLVLQAGLNGVDRTRAGRLVATEASSAAAEKGWTVIPFDAIPDAHATPGQPRSYLYRPEGRPDVHLLIYTRCYPGSERIDADVPRYVEWCRWLVDTGRVAPPKRYALVSLVDRMKKERDTLADKARQNASMRPAADEAARQCAVVEEAIAAMDAVVPEAPSTGGATLPEVSL